MKIGLIPENIFERLALTTGMVPTPLVDGIGEVRLALDDFLI